MGIELRDRVAIVTGAANGIGRATALAFARGGAAIAVWDRQGAAGLQLVREIEQLGGQAVFAQVNVAAQAEVEAAVATTIEHFGKIDILINNAGIVRDAQLIKIKDGNVVGKMSEADWDAVLEVNLKGVFNCTQTVAPHMIRRQYGRIISAASVVGVYGNFGQTNYVAAKAGVIGATKVWARELGRHGITVNAVAPGFIGTDMVASIPQQIREHMVSHTPVGRIGTPDDVAYAYLFLASDAAGFINGALLSVDGGLVVGT